MNVYLAATLKSMTPEQGKAVTRTALATDKRVPRSVPPRMVDALHQKGLIRLVRKGRSDSYALTILGKRVAAAIAEEIEQRRDVLRATVLPRKAARDYRITINDKATTTTTWGIAMASAQKSIRNGATITPGSAGTFTLTAPDGGRTVRFQPAPQG